MEAKNDLDWNLLGKDVWRIIFNKFSFEQRVKLRETCRCWNKWIIIFKPFWPLGKKNFLKY